MSTLGDLLQGYLPGSDPNTPNAFVQTPDMLARRQLLAQALMEQGSSTAPIASPWQGAANLAKALMGGWESGQAMRGQRLGKANAAADQSNVLNQRGLFNDPSEANIPATPGQTTPALQQNDAANDAITDAQDAGANSRAALGAVLGAGSPPPLSPQMAGLASALGAAPQSSAPGPLATASTLGAGTPYGTANVSAGSNPYQASISKLESGGNYGALGPVTPSGDRAYGKYQVMGANIPQWTQAALGQSMTPQQFLASPQAQDAVFNHQFGGYVSKYGPQNAASMWLTGRTLANGGAGATDQNGTTGQAYADQFTRNLGAAPASQAISGATGAHVPTWQEVQADNAAGTQAINSANGGLPGASGSGQTQFGPAGVDRLSPAAAASPLARPAVPPQPSPPPSSGDLGALRTAMSAPTPAPNATDPAGNIAPSHLPVPPNPAQLQGGQDISGLLNIINNPWSSPANIQVAQSLLQAQLPTPLAFEKIGVDPSTGKDLYGSRNPRTGQITPYYPPANPSAPQTSGVPAPPPGVDPDQWRKDMATRQAASVAPSIAEKQAFASHLLDRPSYKEYAASLPTANSLPSLAKENSPAGDTGLIDSIAKIMNPGLAVRQGTYAIFQDEQSGLNRFAGEVDKVLHQNAVLQPETRAQLMRIANDKMQQYRAAWDADAAQQSKIATKGGMDPDEVIPQLPPLASLNLTSISSEKTQAYPVAPGASGGPPAQTPPAPGARKAPDGNWYVADPARPGKYLMVH